MNRPSSLPASPGRRGTVGCCIGCLTAGSGVFRKHGWDDLDRIGEIIAELRQDQKRFEEARLQNGSPAEDRAIALRLAALYYWARGTEILARYMLEGAAGQPVWLARHAL